MWPTARRPEPPRRCARAEPPRMCCLRRLSHAQPATATSLLRNTPTPSGRSRLEPHDARHVSQRSGRWRWTTGRTERAVEEAAGAAAAAPAAPAARATYPRRRQRRHGRRRWRQGQRRTAYPRRRRRRHRRRRGQRLQWRLRLWRQRRRRQQQRRWRRPRLSRLFLTELLFDCGGQRKGLHRTLSWSAPPWSTRPGSSIGPPTSTSKRAGHRPPVLAGGENSTCA